MNLIDYVKTKKTRMVYPQNGAVGLKHTGYKMYEVYLDPLKQLEVARVMDNLIGMDFIYPMDYGAIFVETLGLPLLKPDYDFPSTLENIVKDPGVLRKMRAPNPRSDGNMPVYLQALKLIADNFEKPLAVALVGPFTLAVELVGATDLARNIIRNPDFIDEMMVFTTEVVLNFASEVIESGAKLIQISEPSAVILSPRMFERYVASNLRKIFKELDVFKVLHICGDTTYILTEMLNCGAEGLSLDQLMNLPGVASKIPDDIVMIGNIDPIQVMAEMTPRQVRQETGNLMKRMKPYANYMPSFGCDLMIDTPLQNLRAFIEVATSQNYWRDSLEEI